MRSFRPFALGVVMALTSIGCYQSAFPLDPAPGSAVDPKVLGAWRCVSPDPDDDASTMTIGRARDGVYAFSIQDGDDAPDHYEVHTSRIGGHDFLNIRDLGTKGSTPWALGRHTLLRPDILQLQLVAADGMKGVAETPVAVRRAIERRLADPALFIKGAIVCVRSTRDR